MINLRYCMYSSPKGHPQEVMRKEGIEYLGSTPQSMGNQWWFWGCTNTPETLPKHLSILDEQPSKWIGCGISKEDAERIELEQQGKKE